MATSKTVSSVSKSNKPNTNKVSYTYLIFTVNADGIIEEDMLWDYPGDMPLEKIVQDMHDSWDTMELNRVRVVKVKTIDIKSIKQTLELI
jgi:hypothetical protein